MQHQAAKWRGSSEDARRTEPMRAAAKPIDRRQPSSDQKKVRREMGRKSSIEILDQSPVQHVAINPDARTCDSCGRTGSPALGITGTPECGGCGSSNIRKTDGQIHQMNVNRLYSSVTPRRCASCGTAGAMQHTASGPVCICGTAAAPVRVEATYAPTSQTFRSAIARNAAAVLHETLKETL